jgi:hypothetical protein
MTLTQCQDYPVTGVRDQYGVKLNSATNSVGPVDSALSQPRRNEFKSSQSQILGNMLALQ